MIFTVGERWDELLNPKTIPWDESYADKVFKAYFEARAWLGKGDLEKAGKSIETHVDPGRHGAYAVVAVADVDPVFAIVRTNNNGNRVHPWLVDVRTRLQFRK